MKDLSFGGANEWQRVPASAKATAGPPKHREGGGHANGAGPWAPAIERAGGCGPPSPQRGFGEVSPEPAHAPMRAEADGAKPPAKEVRRALIAARAGGGHWEGHLSSSALATATAVTAIAAASRAGTVVADSGELVDGGIRWLIDTRNRDGGWGDTPDSVSNISTTALVWAALAFGAARGAERPGAAGASEARLSEREPRAPKTDAESAAASAEAWIARAAGSASPETLAAALADRYGKDRTFSVPILTMCAIAGRLGPPDQAWRLIPQLPFELAVFPRRLFGALRLPVVSYALPALISMGLARHRRTPGLPVLRAARSAAASRVLRVLEGLQPDGGGFLEAVPLTSFVTMSLVAAGEAGNPVVAGGLAFLQRSVRPDGSWPIDSNLATWVTTLSVNALGSGPGLSEMAPADRARIVDWLLGQQWRVQHPYTGAAPGGWAWTDLPGGVPDADDTAGALVALAHLGRDEPRVRAAAAAGAIWLLDLQNRDGGIPTFCRGWGALPFDRSSCDLTAHALRAWTAWRELLEPAVQRRVDAAIPRGVAYLNGVQRSDGAFVPLWFGNQHAPQEENAVFGTARVLAGLAPLALAGAVNARPIVNRAVTWLLSAQNDDGGWGGAPAVPSTLEESGVAISGLAAAVRSGRSGDAERAALERGAAWLATATEGGHAFPASPLGLYFARLWYAERLYPLIFAAGALEAMERLTTDG